jgi:hypothetical protein
MEDTMIHISHMVSRTDRIAAIIRVTSVMADGRGVGINLEVVGMAVDDLGDICDAPICNRSIFRGRNE